MDEMVSKVMEMIAELQPYEEFDKTTDLLGEDILDSVSVLVLVQELEEEFSVTITPEEITKENFENVMSVVTLVRSK